MDAINKPNDWFTARFLNPEQTPESLVIQGLSAENTRLEDKEFYKNKPKVKEAFTDDNGVFNEKEFDKAYDTYLAEYQYLSGMNTRDFILQFYEKNPGVFSIPYGHYVTPKIKTSLTPNPLKQSFGIIQLNE
jgi:hypothetical protein